MLIVEYNSRLRERGNNMQLNFKSIDKTLIVSINGEMDHHTSEDARDRIDSQIDKNSAKNVILDFTGVSFMDSAGIGVIIGRYKKISPHYGKVAIVNASPHIKRLLEISGIFKISKLYDNIGNALLYM